MHVHAVGVTSSFRCGSVRHPAGSGGRASDGAAAGAGGKAAERKVVQRSERERTKLSWWRTGTNLRRGGLCVAGGKGSAPPVRGAWRAPEVDELGGDPQRPLRQHRGPQVGGEGGEAREGAQPLQQERRGGGMARGAGERPRAANVPRTSPRLQRADHHMVVRVAQPRPVDELLEEHLGPRRGRLAEPPAGHHQPLEEAVVQPRHRRVEDAAVHRLCGGGWRA
jgi:hypothetical protein